MIVIGKKGAVPDNRFCYCLLTRCNLLSVLKNCTELLSRILIGYLLSMLYKHNMEIIAQSYSGEKLFNEE